MAKREEFDVCVIGTGAGGGVMIDQLTAAGFRVVALQRGPYLRNQDFVDDDELRIVWRNGQRSGNDASCGGSLSAADPTNGAGVWPLRFGG